jgi:hypothetical protein
LGFENKDLLVRYLLGDLPESDRKRLETECLADDEDWEALSAAENDLIDSYARGELSPTQRQQFEEKFLNSRHKNEQLAVARMLMNSEVRQSIAVSAIQSSRTSHTWWERAALLFPSRSHAMRFILLPAGVVIAVAAFLALQNWRLRTELIKAGHKQVELQRQISNLQQQLSNAAVAVGGNKNSPDHSETAQFQLPPISILLTPGILRQGGTGNQNNRLTIPTGAPSVALLLDLQRDQFPRYRVVLETVEGTAIRRVEKLKSQPGPDGGRILAVHLPSQLLRPGDYVITLSGQRPDGQMQVLDSYGLFVTR